MTLTLAIPRAQVLLASGPAEPDARDFELTAAVGSQTFGILSTILWPAWQLVKAAWASDRSGTTLADIVGQARGDEKLGELGQTPHRKAD